MSEIALALGGGGAKGAAHIGVLHRLEREGFQIRALAGTSIGGLVGAVYAAGHSPQEILERFQQVDQNRLYTRRPEDGPALLGVGGVYHILEDMLGERTFDDLRLPFAVTAVDLNLGQEVVLRQGRVAEAVLATIALPGVLPPQAWGAYLLVDGGVLDPVPVAPARALAPHLPVAAVLLSIPTGVAVQAQAAPLISAPEPVLRQIARLRITQALGIFMQSVDVASRALAEMRLEIDRPDVIIRPLVDEVGLLDQVNMADLAWRGDQAVEQALGDLRKALTWRSQVQRAWRWRDLILAERSKNGA